MDSPWLQQLCPFMEKTQEEQMSIYNLTFGSGPALIINCFDYGQRETFGKPFSQISSQFYVFVSQAKNSTFPTFPA